MVPRRGWQRERAAPTRAGEAQQPRAAWARGGPGQPRRRAAPASGRAGAARALRPWCVRLLLGRDARPPARRPGRNRSDPAGAGAHLRVAAAGGAPAGRHRLGVHPREAAFHRGGPGRRRAGAVGGSELLGEQVVHPETVAGADQRPARARGERLWPDVWAWP
jgi:hypothetical protein